MIDTMTDEVIEKFFCELYDTENYCKRITVDNRSSKIEITIKLYSDQGINFGKLQRIADFFGTSDFNVRNKHERFEYSEYTIEEWDYIIYEVEKSKINE